MQKVILQVLRVVVLQARDLSSQVYILNLLLSELMLKLLDTSLQRIQHTVCKRTSLMRYTVQKNSDKMQHTFTNTGQQVYSIAEAV